ncbi:MAG: UbiA family prenyltransferase, partial [Komagataeibacter saccharivorans]|uniref:UbiA family prenyltransferase n=1 Tax=Komagataeibacter saccharivorans TaxID=265959 RepID=UPI0039EC86DC
SVLALIDEARAQGRPVYLATASNERFAHAISAHLGLFDGLFASNTRHNLAASNKAKVLLEVFGDKGFDYVGNHRDDLAIWRHANRCHAIGLDARSSRTLNTFSDVDIIEKPRQTIKIWRKALRVHQYAKNVLVFMPALAAHDFSIHTFVQTSIAFAAYWAAASAIYLLNYVADLGHDRQKPTNKTRPLASGALSVHAALMAIPLLALFALIACLFLPWMFSLTLAGYVALTTGYSFWLKRKMLGDVVGLALLYTARLLGGAAATGIVLSEWLLAFSLFVFTSLALIKRYTELLVRLDGNLPESSSRAYRKDDLFILAAVAAACGTNAVTVFSLYISSSAVREIYTRPYILWLLPPILLFLLARSLMVAHRRQMNDDPVIWALRDRTSLIAVGISALIVLTAI